MNLEMIRKNGGATLNVGGNAVNNKKGYMVSLEKHEIIVDSNNDNAIKNAVEELKAVATKVKGYVGVWLDGGKAYIDVSVRKMNLEKAKEFGIKNNQLAIYGIAENQVIRLRA